MNIEEIGEVSFLPSVNEGDLHMRSFQARSRPLYPGLSISQTGDFENDSSLVSAGTLGCFVKKRGAPLEEGRIYLLSNSHVLASPCEEEGANIIQPGLLDQGDSQSDVVGTLKEFTALKKFETNYIDAAIAQLNGCEWENRSHLGSLKGSRSAVDAGVASVFKTGRTTRTTFGHISAFEMEVPVHMEDVSTGLMFSNQLEIKSSDSHFFSRGGDSGSVIVDDENYVVGLLFAGSNSVTYANPIESVFAALDIELAIS